MGEAERVLSPEACRITGLCERTLQSLSARGEIWGAAKLGRRWTYDRQALRAWIRARENAAANPRTSMSGMAFGMPAPRSAVESIENRYRLVRAQKLRGA